LIWRAVGDVGVAEPRPGLLEGGERVLETFERRRSLSDREIEEQFHGPDRPIFSCPDKAGHHNAVQKYVIAAGRETNELVWHGGAPLTRRVA
jgi:hypothetical protein